MSLDYESKVFSNGNEKAIFFSILVGESSMVFVVNLITETDSPCMGFNT